MRSLKQVYGTHLVQRAKACIKRWKGSAVEITDEALRAFLYLDKLNGRVTKQALEELLGSNTNKLSTLTGTKVTFYIVDMAQHPNGPNERFIDFILDEERLAKYDVDDVDLNAVWIVDKAAPRDALGMEVRKKTFEVRKTSDMMVPKESPASGADGGLRNFIDLRPRQATGASPGVGGRGAPVEGSRGAPAAGGRGAPAARGSREPDPEPKPHRALAEHVSDESNSASQHLEPLHLRIKRNIKEALENDLMHSDDPGQLNTVHNWSTSVVLGLSGPNAEKELEPLRKNFGKFLLKILLDRPCAKVLPHFREVLAALPAAGAELPDYYPLLVRAAGCDPASVAQFDTTGASLAAQDRFLNSILYKDWDALRLVSRFNLARDTDDHLQRDVLLESLRKSTALPADLSKLVHAAFALFHTSIPLGVRCRSAMNSDGAAEAYAPSLKMKFHGGVPY